MNLQQLHLVYDVAVGELVQLVDERLRHETADGVGDLEVEVRGRTSLMSLQDDGPAQAG